MSLTADDIQIIKGLFDDQDAKFAKIDSRFDEQDTKFDTKINALRDELVEKIEDLTLLTGAGFNEVHERIGAVEARVGGLESKLEEVQSTVGRIELVQRAEIQRVDETGEAVTIMKRKLKMA